MLDRQQILELLPHYLAMMVVAFVGVSIVRATVGDLGFWPEFAIILVLVVLYRPIVVRLDLAPSAWEPD